MVSFSRSRRFPCPAGSDEQLVSAGAILAEPKGGVFSKGQSAFEFARRRRLSGWSDEALLKAQRGESLSVSDYPPDWPRRFAAGGAIIGPPFALFLLGYGLLWIGRGFRPKT
jgi:hypothetical protein